MVSYHNYFRHYFLLQPLVVRAEASPIRLSLALRLFPLTPESVF